MNSSNPYKWNQVHLDLFYGRGQILNELTSRLLDGQSFALMGGRRMGKTTLLRKVESEIQSQFASWMSGGMVIIPIYIDMLSFEDLSDCDVISREILRAATEFANHKNLIRSPKTTPSDRDLLNPFARELSNLIRSIPEYRVQFVILFDEISPIVHAGWGTTYLGNWRALLHNTPSLSRHISAAFVGAHEIVQLAVDVSSPLANILTWKCLNSFSVEDTRLLVREPTTNGLPSDFHTRVFSLTGGHPFLIQYLMFHVVESGWSNPNQALDDARQRFLDNEHRQFHNWYTDFDETARQVYEIVLSEGTINKTDLVKSFEDNYEKTQVQNCLNILCSYGVVRRVHRQAYQWSGELFRDWYLENCGRVVVQQIPSSGVVDQAFWECWDSRLSDLGLYNILVEGETDKLYLELAAKRYQEAHDIDLLNRGDIRIIAGRGTKQMGPEFGVLQLLEAKNIRYVVVLDGDDAGKKAAEAMSGFGAQKNRHYFQLSRADYKDKGGKSWDVEIEDMLPQALVEAFIQQYPEAEEERFQRQNVRKFVIDGRPVERDGKTYDYKMMLVDYIDRYAKLDDLQELLKVLRTARKCMGVKNS